MFPILQIGPLALQTPGLFLILGIWLGLALTEKWAHLFQANPTILYNLVFNTIIAGLIGARLVYGVKYAAIFIDNPINLISLNPGLLDPSGGVVAGLLAALIYGNRINLPFWNTLDALTPFLAILIISIGMSNFASGDAFGAETTLPWGITLWGVKRHPSQIYEVLFALIILGWLWAKVGISHSKLMIPGEIFLLFSAITAAGRLFLEAFRGDSYLIVGQIKFAQILAWGVMAVCLLGLIQLKFNPNNPNNGF